MRFILVMLVALTFSVPSLAGDGTITINSDGSVTESDNPMARHEAAKAAVLKAEKIHPAEADTPAKDIVNPEPETEVKAAEKPAAEKKETVKKPSHPAKPKAAKPKASAAVQKSPKAASKKSGSDKSQSKIKWNKPPKTKHRPITIEPENADISPTQAEPARPLTKDEALRAAIQIAPPFSHANVVQDQVKGRGVFRVMLQTDEGQQDILVDQETGDIVKE